MMARFLILLLFELFVATGLLAAEDVKRPAGEPAFHCRVFDGRCEDSLMTILSSNPHIARNARKIVAQVRNRFENEAMANRRTGGEPAWQKYWGCVWYSGVVICAGEEGIDFYF